MHAHSRVLSRCLQVGTGYSLDELAVLRRRLQPHWQNWNQKKLPACFKKWKPGKRDDIPDFWIEPRNSVLMELKGYEVTATDQFAANLCLRFPRVVKIRDDKDWTECMNMKVGAWPLLLASLPGAHVLLPSRPPVRSLSPPAFAPYTHHSVWSLPFPPLLCPSLPAPSCNCRS